MDTDKKISDLEQRVRQLEQKRISKQDVTPNAIKQAHIDGLIIFRGLAADRPSNGDTEIQAYFAEDTDALSIWNRTDEVWQSETLT